MKQLKVSEKSSFFKIPIEPSKAVYKEKASKFISLLFPVASLDEAEEIRKKTAKEFYDATHHCYAIRIGLGKELIEKFSDAGEPSHTAGEPILNALRQKNLTNVLCIVVRYYGGTKLGTGGLIRAYSQSAVLAIDSAKLQEKYESDICIIETNFHSEGIIRYTVSKLGGKIIETDRDKSGIKLKLEIAKQNRSEFEKKIEEFKEKWKNEFIWKWK